MFKFSIRDLLWLTVVVALAVSWGVSHRGKNSTITNLKAQLIASDLEIQFVEAQRDVAIYKRELAQELAKESPRSSP